MYIKSWRYTKSRLGIGSALPLQAIGGKDATACEPSAGADCSDVINHGYLTAVWPFLLGVFLRYCRPRGLGNAFKNDGGDAPHISEGRPGATGPARLQKCIHITPARLHSGTQQSTPVCQVPEASGSTPEVAERLTDALPDVPGSCEAPGLGPRLFARTLNRIRIHQQINQTRLRQGALAVPGHPQDHQV